MDLYFITGNEGKFKEIASLIPRVQQLDIDVPEIQEIDPKKIIEEKLNTASQQHKGEFIIEDTSLYIDALHGLPGPLIKWFLKSMGNEGLARLVNSLDSNAARAITWLGYKQKSGDTKYFEGEIQGNIVSPRGTNGFGWDAIFQPVGSKKTFAQMGTIEKQRFSMRRLAVEKLLQWIR